VKGYVFWSPQIEVRLMMREQTPHHEGRGGHCGFYESPGWVTKYPKIQILTIAELLAGAKIDMPPLSEMNRAFKKAKRAESLPDVQPNLEAWHLEEDGDD
jgi:hypothetical protein